MDCGPACLKMIVEFYGRNIPIQRLREKCEIGKAGVNLLGIANAAELLGFQTKSLKLGFHEIMRQHHFPVILHWRQNHFIVLYKIKKGQFYIADPAEGKLVLSAEQFVSQWIPRAGTDELGIVLLLEPAELFFKSDDIKQLKNRDFKFATVFRYLLPFKRLLFQLFTGLLVASFFQLVLPLLTQNIVDTGISTGNVSFIVIILIAQLALFSGRMIIEFIRGWILLYISIRVNISILTDFLKKLMRLPIAYFDSKNTGDVLQRMNDHSNIESFLTGSSINILFSIFNLLVFSIILIFYDINIFGVFICSGILYALWVVKFMKRKKKLNYERFGVLSQEQNSMIQLIQAMQEIRLNGGEQTMRRRWENFQAKLFKLSKKSLSVNQWQQTGAFFINESKNILITFLAANSVIQGDITLGAMVAIQYIVGQLNSPVEQLVSFMQSYQNARISFDRLNEIKLIEDEEPLNREFVDELPPIILRNVTGGVNRFEQNNNELAGYRGVEKENIIPAGNFKPAIVLSNIFFSYPGAGNEPVLKNINITFPLGKTTAIVGTSGSGKTTLLKLLLRYYQPQSGTIQLHDTSLYDIRPSLWRRHCGSVMQDGYIFSDTIENNIAFGQGEIDKQRLDQAIEIANLSEFIRNMPQGVYTKIGAEAAGISVGQKQRILIARAVYRLPDFIFFDEATNSLDANNERMILENLSNFFEGRTVVVVAHRLSTVKKADQIVVLDKGIIAECGIHTELVQLKGKYYNLVKNQLELGQ